MTVQEWPSVGLDPDDIGLIVINGVQASCRILSA